MRSEWADYAVQGNKLMWETLGNGHTQLSQLTEPPWTDPGLKSGIGVCKLSQLFKKDRGERRGAGMISRFLPASIMHDSCNFTVLFCSCLPF